MSKISISVIRDELERWTGLELVGDFEEVEGGVFGTIRPTEPERPYGFSILLTRMPRRVEASFRIDRQAKGLLESMRYGSDTGRSVLIEIINKARKSGQSITFLINDSEMCSHSDFPEEPWHDVVLECSEPLSDVRASLEEIDDRLTECGFTCLSSVLTLLPVESVTEIPFGHFDSLPEGAKISVTVNRYERNAINRTACLAVHGFICHVCEMDFQSMYGDLGAGYIHVHHVTPISQMGGAYELNPVTDLVPLCANCHAMIHRRDPPLSVEQLRGIVAHYLPNPEDES